MARWFGWAVAGFVLAVAATSGAASNSDIRACRQDCQATYQDTITDPSDCLTCPNDTCDPSCSEQLSAASAGYSDCLTCLMGEAAGGCSSNMTLNPAGQSFFQVCTNQCASPLAGVCAQNLTCVRTCRVQLFHHQQRCKTRFQNQVRSVCRQIACGADVNYFQTAKRQLRQCKRNCKTNPGAAVASVAPQLEAATAVPLQSGGGSGDCNCQQRCIRGVAANCFNQCQSACMGDRDALNLCERACTNAQCFSVKQACAIDAPTPSASFATCCSQCASSGAGSCDGDAGIDTDPPICVPTTSTTTTTSTSTSTSSTGVTTTTFAGQTTTIPTTSTTTLIPPIGGML